MFEGRKMSRFNSKKVGPRTICFWDAPLFTDVFVQTSGVSFTVSLNQVISVVPATLQAGITRALGMD